MMMMVVMILLALCDLVIPSEAPVVRDDSGSDPVPLLHGLEEAQGRLPLMALKRCCPTTCTRAVIRPYGAAGHHSPGPMMWLNMVDPKRRTIRAKPRKGD